MKKHFSYLLCIMLLLISATAHAQEDKIKGKVVDAHNEPVIGASVLIKGDTNGTITDVDGLFTLNAVKGTLVVSYLGYKTVEQPVTDKTFYLITMEEDSHVLDDIVVVGYGTQSKRNITGAVSDLKSDAISRTAATSTSGALAGKMPGISVRTKDARPGKGASLEIRNLGNPLYVIDGIPYGGQTGSDWVQSSNVSGADVFNALNIEDIESISILKDASAAVYGLRASSGVVLVTTKKGKNEESIKVNINGYYGWQNLTRFPKMANAAQYTRGLVEAAQNE